MYLKECLVFTLGILSLKICPSQSFSDSKHSSTLPSDLRLLAPCAAAVAMETLSGANGAFAVDLYHALRKDSLGCSLVLSPLSLSTALAMVHLGARTHTQAQMAKVQYGPGSPEADSVSFLH